MSSLGTTVIYNGVEMVNVITREWNQEVTYDDSQTDRIADRYTLVFEGIIHTQNLSNLVYHDAGPSISPFVPAGMVDEGRSFQANPVDHYTSLKSRLMEPRGQLQVYFAGDLVLNIRSWTQSNQPEGKVLLGRVDVVNGPRPISADLVHITGNSTFRVRFTIETSVVECADISGSAKAFVLNNRWSIREVMDEDFFTTRTISGRMVLASNEIPPFAHKYLVVPGLEEGFKRKRVDFMVQENGLACDYTITDAQVKTAAPFPATRIQCRHAEQTADGITFHTAISCSLQGPPHVDRRWLISRAIQVVDSRTNMLSKIQNADFFVESGEIVDNIGERSSIEFNIRIRHVPGNAGLGEFLSGVRSETLGTPLELGPLTIDENPNSGIEYDPTVSWEPRLHGYLVDGGVRSIAVLNLLHTYLQSPCTPLKGINVREPPDPKGEDKKRGDSENKYEVEIKGQSTGELDTRTRDDYGTDHRRAIYTYSRYSTDYDTDSARVQMPIADVVGGGGPHGNNNSVVFALARPQGSRVLVIDVERIAPRTDDKKAEWPHVPKPEDLYKDGTLTGTLLRHRITPYPATLTASGDKRVFRLRAEYVYALNRPPNLDEKVAVGANPYTSIAGGATQFDPGAAYKLKLS